MELIKAAGYQNRPDDFNDLQDDVVSLSFSALSSLPVATDDRCVFHRFLQDPLVQLRLGKHLLELLILDLQITQTLRFI